MKSTLLAATACVILLSSCQKEVDGELTPTPGTDSTATSNRVKTYTESVTSASTGNYNMSFNVVYDDNSRITGLVSTASPDTKFVYAYPSSHLATGDIYDQGALTIHEDFYLNDDAFLDSTFQYNDTEDTTTEKYFYNTSKQLTQVREYTYTAAAGSVLDNTTTYTYDANGNVLKTQDTDGNTDSYEYYTDLSYTPPLLGTPGSAMFNKKSNLVKKHTLTSGGTTVGSADYTYTFDDKNRISTEKAVLSDGSIATKSYTYY